MTGLYRWQDQAVISWALDWLTVGVHPFGASANPDQYRAQDRYLMQSLQATGFEAEVDIGQ